MLQITVPSHEMYDEEKNEFFMTKEVSLRLEHSLVSISKWETKWQKPFLDRKPKTKEESIDYIRCMTLNQNVDPEVYYGIDSGLMNQINDYIESDRTATWFRETKKKPSTQVITSELVYYWMTAYNIPWEAQKWHFSRLITLIKICNIKNQPPKKMSKSAILRQNTSINEARLKALNTKG